MNGPITRCLGELRRQFDEREAYARRWESGGVWPVELPEAVHLHGLAVAVEERHVHRTRRRLASGPVGRHRVGSAAVTGNSETGHFEVAAFTRRDEVRRQEV